MSINALQKCIEKNKANNSQAREVIFRILLDTDECLDVAEILEEAQKIYPKKISLNTVYRHLNFFVKCGLAIALQNENKKAYYSLVDQDKRFFSICPQCGLIEKIYKHEKELSDISEKYTEAEYITIHQTCKNCVLKLQ